MLPKYGEECQNVLSRSVVYPMSSVQRFPVLGEMVSWQVAFHCTKMKFSIKDTFIFRSVLVVYFYFSSISNR